MRYMAQRFIEFVVRSSDAGEGVISPRLNSLIARCKKIADFSGAARGDLDGEFEEIARLCAKEFQAKIVPIADVTGVKPLPREISDNLNRDEESGLTPRKAFLSLQAISLQKTAYAFFEQNRLPEAEQLYRTILQNFPDDIRSLCNLGGICRLRGKVQDAIALYRKAIDLRPNELLAQVCLGIIYVEMNKKEDALACFKKAISIDPEFEDRDYIALAHYNLARLLHSSGRLQEALAHLEKALFYKPDYPAAAEGYNHVRQALGASKHPNAR